MAPATARAQPAPPALLQVTAPPSTDCPDEAGLSRAVAARLGRDPFAADATRRIDVRFAPATRGPRRARISIHDGASAVALRHLVQPGPTCERLADAVTLAVTLAIDPDVLLRPPPAPTPPVPAPVACPEVTCPACAVCPPPPPPPPPLPPPIRPVPRPPVFVALTGGVSAGLVPSVTGVFGVSAVVGLDARWSFDLGASFTPIVPTRDGTVGVGRTIGRVGACIDAGPPWVRLGGCADVVGGVVHMTALSLDPVAPGDRGWFGAAVEAHARFIPWRWIVVGVHARGVVPVFGWAPRVEGASEPSFSPSPFAFEGEVSVGARLQ